MEMLEFQGAGNKGSSPTCSVCPPLSVHSKSKRLSWAQQHAKVILYCVLKDTREMAVSRLCLTDSMKRLTPAQCYNSPYLLMSERCLCAY